MKIKDIPNEIANLELETVTSTLDSLLGSLLIGLALSCIVGAGIFYWFWKKEDRKFEKYWNRDGQGHR